ncbi:hypothetical protein [Sphingobacterium mizutaii]|nr:hypothetical protein [Sphingobacterium mizutaii]
MRVKTVTKDFYIQQLGFQEIGFANFESYMILKKDEAELHFFIFLDLIPEENYGQVYIRVNHIEQLYQELVDTWCNHTSQWKFGRKTLGSEGICYT